MSTPAPAGADPGSRWIDSLAPLRARHGRPAAAGFLLIVLALVAGLESAPELALRNALFDSYQRLAPRTRINDAAIVIAIDERSLAELGQWPWPRTRVAALIEAIAVAGPAAIGVDVLFAEPDRYAPARLAGELALDGAAIDQLVAALPDPDQRLAEAIRAAPVVLGVAGVDALPERPGSVGRYVPVRSFGGDPADVVPDYPAILRSIEVIDAAAAGRGLINAELERGIVRRVPTLVTDPARTLVPGFALEVLRTALGDGALTARLEGAALARIEVAGHTIPTAPAGEWWLHFSPWQERPQFSVAAVLSGEIGREVLGGRIALIGYTALGLLDNVTTPFGQMPGVHVHAEAIDNLIDGRLLARPRWTAVAEPGLLVLLAGAIVLLVPRVRPRHAVLAFALALALLFALGMMAFIHGALLLDVATPALAAGLVFGMLLAAELSASQANRAALRRALVASHEAQLRLEGELDGARRIQMAMLPPAPGVFAREPRVDLAALVRPARSVGGDLYDFFAVGPDRLFFLIGDVAGKGLPAALFMALAKASIKGAALRVGGDPGRALSEAGQAMAENNSEMLFVTVFAGLLDLDSGELAWSSAGHDSPWRLAGGPAPQRGFDSSGPPLCVIDDFDYPTSRTRLAPGECLCLVTDGVTEAQDAARTLFGAERLAAVLAGFSSAAIPAAVLESVLRAVDAHAAGAEQADDVTLLVMQWQGRG